jgi:MraZ protein
LITFVEKKVGESVVKWWVISIFALSKIIIHLIMRFSANIDAKVDMKNRVFIPAVFRKVLIAEGEQVLYLRKDIYKNCIIVYPESVWEYELIELRSRLNRWNPEEQDLYRQFMFEAEAVEPDGSGRILISKKLLTLVGIESEVRFVGVDNTLEIWPIKELEKPLVDPDYFRQRMQEIMTKSPRIDIDNKQS